MKLHSASGAVARWRGAVAAVAAMVALMVAVAVVLRFDNGGPRNT